MLLSICGTPSPLSLAMVRLVTLIAEATIGTPTRVTANEIGRLRQEWSNIPKENRKSILIYADAPQGDLIRLFEDSNIPAVVVTESVAHIVAYQISISDAEFSAALQIATNSITQIMQINRKAINLSFDDQLYSENVLDIADKIIEFFRIPCDGQQKQHLKPILSGGNDTATFSDFIAARFPEWQSATSVIASLAHDQREALQTVASDYDLLATGQPITEINWPSRSFFEGETPGHHLAGPIALTGAARCVFCGPYFCLPPGRWNCEVHIEVQDCRNDMIGLMEVFAGNEALNAVSMRFPRRGAFAIDISFEVAISHKPLQVRLHLLKGAIEGEILLRGARLSPDSASVQTPDLQLPDQKRLQQSS